jgi:hypothetical protein
MMCSPTTLERVLADEPMSYASVSWTAAAPFERSHAMPQQPTAKPEQPTASRDEVERMMRNLCAYALSEPDPLQRYLNLTHQQAVFAGVVEALQVERGHALADFAEVGVPLDRVVQAAGVSTPTQVRSLVKAAGRKLPTARSLQSKAAGGKSATAAKSRRLPKPTLPPTSRAVNGSRVLTAEERVALGLPATGSIGVVPRQRSRSRG